MIKGLTAGTFLQVDNGNVSGVYLSTNNMPMTGMTRYYNNNLEVYDGQVWQQVPSSYAHVKLSDSASSAIQWALNKMAEEAELNKLAENHPAVQAALENVKRAEEQLKATVILSKEAQEPIQHHPV